jgi:hypothetical protein
MFSYLGDARSAANTSPKKIENAGQIAVGVALPVGC